MFIPPHFAVPGQEALSRIFHEASFAILVSTDNDGLPFATHLPFSYDPERGEQGTLIAHMARANPHGALLSDKEALVIFQGPHSYISPNYYATDINVPTWNYVAVHAYGTPRVITEPEEVLSVLERLTSENEAEQTNPWTPGDLDPKRLKGLMNGIIAFEIPISRIEGKAKLGQNKSEEDQTAVRNAIGTLF
jgi:transcriptional regulator